MKFMQVYSVTQVSSYLKLLLDGDFLIDKINIKGEVSNIVYNASGNIYFKIKDTECMIDAVIYKSNSSILENIDKKSHDVYILDKIDKNNNKLENGMKIICSGKISSYVKNNNIQLVVKDIKYEGTGEILTEFNLLKKKLFDEGLFDEDNKKEIPLLPEVIGVITSETGAALKDIINVAKTRNPNIKILIIPTVVQGNTAHIEIIKAIKKADNYSKSAKLDVIILARGGGSKEDLDCFNNELLAREIFNCSTPIVTGIGHEIDFTIADFVADKRASTPSMACEICTPSQENVKYEFKKAILKINKILLEKLEKNKSEVTKNINKISINQKNLVDYKITSKLENIENKIELLNLSMETKLSNNKNKLDKNINKIEVVSPMNILNKGYSVVKNNENNKIIKSKQDTKAGDIINIAFLDGDVEAVVIKNRVL